MNSDSDLDPSPIVPASLVALASRVTFITVDVDASVGRGCGRGRESESERRREREREREREPGRENASSVVPASLAMHVTVA
jgi:hypothetical protein